MTGAVGSRTGCAWSSNPGGLTILSPAAATLEVRIDEKGGEVPELVAKPSQPRRQRPGHPPRPRSTWWNRGQGDVDAERRTSRRVSRSGRTRAGGKGRPGRD